MGIKGLHKGLKFCSEKANIRKFSGKTIAVDASSWLHKSVYSVSAKYVEAMEKRRLDPHCVRVSARYISSRCRELLNSFRIAKIMLVMDGKRCPLKADTNDEREHRRQQNLMEARSFSRRGQRHKAEEKYKMCIKIRDELTHAVMKEVKKDFQSDGRVQFVWSPYEADSQLAKLCIDCQADAVVTEDSDVLVYSAASHVAFPVLFKLDRGTGNCDSICMDWLLTCSDDTNGTKPHSALESLLKNLGSRQQRRPGFGVRLFVQACVLAGCDYAPNKLSGIGLVNAFKLVRDNAFRNDSVRFAKILESLPHKAKKDVDTNAYEIILAKSEAVFYYHLVRHLDGTVKPLSGTPRLSEEENGEIHHISNHFPFMKRFDGDLSFLGKIEDQVSNPAPPVTEILVRKEQGKRNMPPEVQVQKVATTISKPKPFDFQKSGNPYLSRRRLGEKQRRPLMEVNGRGKQSKMTQTNPFFRSAKEDDRKSTKGSNLFKSYMHEGEEVRFVKRQFPPENDKSCTNASFRKSKRLGLVNKSGQERSESQINVEQPEDQNHNNDPVNQPQLSPVNQEKIGSFDYELVEDVIESLPPSNAISCSTSEIHNRTREYIPESRNNEPSQDSEDPVQEDTHPGKGSKEDSPDFFDLTGLDSDFDTSAPNLNFSPRNEGRAASKRTRALCSKYFEKHSSRRVTLEPTDLLGEPQCVSSSQSNGLETVVSRQEANFGGGNSSIENFENRCDEIIDSPPECEDKARRASLFGNSTHTRPHRESATSVSRRSSFSHKIKRVGPLESAFRRQKQLSAQAKSQKREMGSSRSLAQTLKRKKNSLTSYFQPKKMKPVYSQLQTNSNENDEDFLWKTP